MVMHGICRLLKSRLGKGYLQPSRKRLALHFVFYARYASHISFACSAVPLHCCHVSVLLGQELAKRCAI